MNVGTMMGTNVSSPILCCGQKRCIDRASLLVLFIPCQFNGMKYVTAQVQLLVLVGAQLCKYYFYFVCATYFFYECAAFVLFGVGSPWFVIF